MYNSKFTSHCTEWAIKYVQNKNISFAFDESPKNISKLNLDDRNIYAINISILNKFINLADLSVKGHNI